MRYLLSILLLALLTGCGTAPKPETGTTWEVTSYGGSMYLPGRLTLVYDYDAVEVGAICAYTWGGRILIHRVRGKLNNGWIMKGDLNTDWDEGVMTPGNYVGTVVPVAGHTFMKAAAATCLLRDLGEGEYFRHNGREGMKIHAQGGKNVIWLKTGRPSLLGRMVLVQPTVAPDMAALNVVEMFLCRGNMEVFV